MALQFLSLLFDPGVPGVRSMGLKLSERDFADLTDVTLGDEDTNSILNDNANRAIQGNVTQPGGQICNICMCRHLMANLGTNASFYLVIEIT